MFSQFCYYSNAFTDQECDKIIELGLNTGLKDGVLGDGSHGGESRVDFEMRKSKLRFINEWDPGANWIFKKFWDHALQANRDWFKLHIESLESMQFTRYEGNAEQPDHYNYHQDVFLCFYQLIPELLHFLLKHQTFSSSSSMEFALF